MKGLFVVPTQAIDGFLKATGDKYAVCRSLNAAGQFIAVETGTKDFCEKQLAARAAATVKPPVRLHGVTYEFDQYAAIETRRQHEAGSENPEPENWFTYYRGGELVTQEDPSWRRDEWNAWRERPYRMAVAA